MRDLFTLYYTIKDLHTFSDKDITDLVDYYNIPRQADDVHWLLANKILENYYYANMNGGLVGTEIELPDPDSDSDVRFSITERIGRGAQGSAYIIVSPTGKEYVLKITPAKFINELHVFKRIMLEGLHPEYVVRIYAYLIGNDNNLYLILERLPGDNIGTMITNFTVPETKVLARQAVNGLAYLHDRDIFHRDIKPENIIWDPTTKQLKFIDFGAACGIGIRCPYVQGAPLYAAPNLMEMIDKDDESPESQKGLDVYALGIILYQLAHRAIDPFGIEDTPPTGLAQLIDFILEKKQLTSHTGDKELDELVNSMIQNDPSKRITIHQAQDLVNGWDSTSQNN